MAKTRQARTAAGKACPKRGEIYLTALDPTVGRAISRTGPALVIQNDTSNRFSDITMVAPITSTVRLPLSPLHVLLPASHSTGLTAASVAVFNKSELRTAKDSSRSWARPTRRSCFRSVRPSRLRLDWLKVLLMYPPSLVPAFSSPRSLFR